MYLPEHPIDRFTDGVLESLDRTPSAVQTTHTAGACGQKERDLAILRKHANTFAVMILANFPEDYESRKRIITNGIVSALTQATPIDYRETAAPEMLEALEACESLIEFYAEREMNAPANSQEAVRDTREKLHMYRAAIRKARGEQC